MGKSKSREGGANGRRRIPDKIQRQRDRTVLLLKFDYDERGRGVNPRLPR